MYKPDPQAYLARISSDRTTTVDGAPASDTDKQSISRQINLLNAVRRNLCASPWRCLCRTGNLRTSLLCATYPSGASQEFGLTPANSSISLSISTGCWLLVCCLLAPYPMPLVANSDGHGATVGLHLYVTFDNDDSWHGILIMRALIGLSLSGVELLA